MSDLLIATREKERTCRSNGNDMAADEYKAYADKIEELQATAISDVDIIKRQTKRIVALRKKVGELEAKIDSLMFEYCPDEMTEEQTIRAWVESENE